MLHQYFPILPSMGSLPDGCVLTQAVQQAWNKSRSCRSSDIPGSSLSRCCAICLLATHFHSHPFILVFIKPTDSPETANMVTWLRGPIGRMVEILGCCSCFYSHLPVFAPPHVFSLRLPPSPPPFTRWLSDKTGIFFSSSNQMWLHSTHLEITFSFRWSRPADLLLLPAAVCILCWD